MRSVVQQNVSARVKTSIVATENCHTYLQIFLKIHKNCKYLTSPLKLTENVRNQNDMFEI